jgi:hypothetical protein
MDKGKKIKSFSEIASDIKLITEALEVGAGYSKRVTDAIDKAKEKISAQDRVEGAVARAAAETISEAKPDKKAPARNTQEFIIKYAQKRFSPSTAGKAYLLSFLLDAYSMREKGVQTTLWDIEHLKSRITAEEDIRSFDAYYHLTEWLRNLYENSRTMRNALQGVLSDFYHTTTSIIAAENIRKCVCTPNMDKLQAAEGADIREEINSNPDTLLTLWLNTISLEEYTPQEDGGHLVNTLRENIGEGLRYIVAYHTFLDVIADYTGIPECAYLKIKEEPLRKSLSSLNEALELLRDNVKKYREPEIRAASASRPEGTSVSKIYLSPNLENLLPASLTFWTPEYLEETMRSFKPVEEPQPVPEERVHFLRESIRRDFKREYINWYVLYSRYSISYRIPAQAATPPTGRNKVKSQAEEVE